LGETTNVQHCLDIISSSTTELSFFTTLCLIKCNLCTHTEVQDVNRKGFRSASYYAQNLYGCDC
jgi:hypothetical protein